MTNTLLLLALGIDTAGSILIAGYVLAASIKSLRQSSPTDARELIASGVIYGLDFKLGATLIKTLALSTWQQLAMFTAVYCIRFIVKRSFANIQKHSSALP